MIAKISLPIAEVTSHKPVGANTYMVILMNCWRLSVDSLEMKNSVPFQEGALTVMSFPFRNLTSGSSRGRGMQPL